MKKLVAIMMAFVIVLCFTACAGKETKENKAAWLYDETTHVEMSNETAELLAYSLIQVGLDMQK